MALDQYINRSLSEGYSLGHASSFAIDPNLERREKLDAIKLLFPLLPFYLREFNLSRLIACGVIKSKTNITFQKLGFLPLSHAGEVLPSVINPALQNTEVEVMTMENCSAECEASAKINQELWDKRIEISDKAYP